MAHDTASSAKFFDSSAVGWLLRLLFFPTGLVTLLLTIILLRRAPPPEEPSEVKKAARLRLRERQQGTQRRLRPDEISRVCVQYVLPRPRQTRLEETAVLDRETCGYCLGSGRGKRYAQLPCGHFVHATCLKDSLEQDLATCPECGWSVKALFDIQPQIPEMEG